MSNTFAVPGPKAIGFRFGYAGSPGKLAPIVAEHREENAPDILEGPATAKCLKWGNEPGHHAPQRGCACGIHAFSRLGHLVESNQSEWKSALHVPLVGLYWGKMRFGERGFRAEHQVIIGMGEPMMQPRYTGGDAEGRALWREWLEAFQQRKLPIALIAAPTRYDMLHEMAKLGEQYGIYLEAIPKDYRVRATPVWVPPPPTIQSGPPGITHVPGGGGLPPIVTRRGGSNMPAVPLQARPHPNPPLNVPLAAPPARNRTVRMPSTGYCQCGCGASTKAMFKPGHDATHKGNLKRAAKRGDQAAIDELNKRGW